jgi:hypothetical protein
MCRQCARPRARNVRQSGRVRATMRLMSVFLFRINGRSCPNTRKRAMWSRCVDGYIRPRMFGELFVVESRRVRSAMCGGSIIDVPLLPAVDLHHRTSLSLLSVDFPCGLLSLSPCSYIAGFFLLVAQSAATCSRWFTARGFFYPEAGGHAFLRNVG